MADSDQSLHPVHIFSDELTNDDTQIRLHAIRRISTIASALGAEKTRNELLPELNDHLDDEEIVLAALAEELAQFVEYVGGNSFAHFLLPPLETLCREETKVREKAVESCITIAKVMSKEQIIEYFYPMVKSLASSDWFTNHISATGLFAAIYSQVPEEKQKELREMYAKLVSNPTPAVRRAAAGNLGKFAKVIEPANIVADVLPMYKQIALDEQDSVRLLTIEICVVLSTKLTPEQIQEFISPVILTLSKDGSWRVRYMTANRFCDLLKELGKDVKPSFVDIYVTFLKDSEPEVRTIAAANVADFCALIPVDAVVSSIIPIIKDQANDSSHHVRASLASNIMNISPIIGKEKTLDLLLDVFLQLLKDENPDVRLNIISKLDVVNNVIGIESVSDSLLPAVVQLAEDKQWRVRLAIINYIPLLAGQLGVEFFDENLCNLCLSWLGDPVFSIREAATNNIKRLIEVLGLEWAQNSIIPKVLNFYSHQNYLYRLTTLLAISALCSVVGSTVVDGTLLPLVIRMASDPVPNIRFNVAKTLEIIIGHSEESVIQRTIRPTLNTLLEDPDGDVKFFAKQALMTIST